MNITRLQHFYEIFQTKNMTQAANNLYITQQGLSRSIKSLEKELGVSLFIRTSSGVIPTPYAEAIIEDVKEILDKSGLIQKKLLHMINANEQTLTIDCNQIILDSFPHGTKHMLEDILFPDLEMTFNGCDESTALEHLLNEEADLAHIAAPADRESFQVFTLKSYSVAALISPSNPMSKKEQISLKDLDQKDIISFSPNWNIYHTFMRACSDAGIRPNITFEVTDALHMYFLCKENEGIGICPSFYCEYLPHTDICIVPVKKDELVWSTAIVLKKGKPLSPVLLSYIQAFKNMSQE